MASSSTTSGQARAHVSLQASLSRARRVSLMIFFHFPSVNNFFKFSPFANYILNKARFMSRLNLPPTHHNFPHPCSLIVPSPFFLSVHPYPSSPLFLPISYPSRDMCSDRSIRGRTRSYPSVGGSLPSRSPRFDKQERSARSADLGWIGNSSYEYDEGTRRGFRTDSCLVGEPVHRTSEFERTKNARIKLTRLFFSAWFKARHCPEHWLEATQALLVLAHYYHQHGLWLGAWSTVGTMVRFVNSSFSFLSSVTSSSYFLFLPFGD